MSTKKSAAEETARLTITCDATDKCNVEIKGDKHCLTAAFATLLMNDDNDNEFREMIELAIHVVVKEQKRNKKAAVKKKEE